MQKILCFYRDAFTNTPTYFSCASASAQEERTCDMEMTEYFYEKPFTYVANLCNKETLTITVSHQEVEKNKE
jgi:hypothetical protein